VLGKVAESTKHLRAFFGGSDWVWGDQGNSAENCIRHQRVSVKEELLGAVERKVVEGSLSVAMYNVARAQFSQAQFGGVDGSR
jgi:hypothetical protein